jgi:photosystem II stability/assembly factor-like uncharacterized protein
MPIRPVLGARPRAARRAPCHASILTILSIGASAHLAAQSAPEVTTHSTGVTASLFGIFPVSDSVVWVSGTRGTVLRSLDGGVTWTRRPVPGGDSLQFRDVHAFGADTAWVLAIGNGPASRIYRTTDGGASWREQFRNADTAAFYDCFTFLDSRRGIVYGDAAHGRTHILRTDDGGTTWPLLPPASVPAPLDGEGAYAASGRCVVHAGDRHVFIATGGPGSRLFTSDDAGMTWQVRETPFVRSASAGTSGLDFVTPQRGIGVAGDMTNLRGDSARASVAVTDDGGRSWQLRSRPPLPGAFTGVTWVPGAGSETAVVAGFGGVFATRDAGRTWTVLSTRGHTGIGAVGRTAWVGGTDGAVLRVRFGGN